MTDRMPLSEEQLRAWEEMLRRDNAAICEITDQWIAATRRQRREAWFWGGYSFLCGLVTGAALMRTFLT